MVGAAEALIRSQDAQIDFRAEDTERIVREFKDRFYETKLFFDPYAGGKFAQYFFRAHEEAGNGNVRGDLTGTDAAHHRIEEAHLFVEAVYACHGRILERFDVTA
jgi:sulfite reductase (ferredoxin)